MLPSPPSPGVQTLPYPKLSGETHTTCWVRQGTAQASSRPGPCTKIIRVTICSLIKAAASIHFLPGTPYTLLLVNFKTILWSKMLQSSPSCKENQGPESKWADLPSWKGWSWGLTQAVGFILHPLHQPTGVSQSYTHACIRHIGNERPTSRASPGQLHFRNGGQEDERCVG